MEQLRNRLWQELYQAKYNTDYLAELVRIHRRRHVLLNGLIASAAAIGLVLQKYFDYAATIALLTTLLGSVFKHLGPVWLMTDDQLGSLDRENTFYEIYLSQLERLWIYCELGTLTDEQALQQFFTIKEKEAEHIVGLNQLSAYFRINTVSIHKKADEYVKSVFFSHTAPV